MRTTRIRRLVGRGTIAVAIGALVLAATPATATAAPANDINQHYQSGEAQFTNCPNKPPAQETLCLGVDVFAEEIDGTIQGQPTQGSGVFVNVVQVHFHPDGTFDIDEQPIATGDAPLKVDFDGFNVVSIKGKVPLSDNTVAAVHFSLRATTIEPSHTFKGHFEIPECASGFGTVKVRQHFRDASTLGSVDVHGSKTTPTSALITPFILDETDTGNCDPV